MTSDRGHRARIGKEMSNILAEIFCSIKLLILFLVLIMTKPKHCHKHCSNFLLLSKWTGARRKYRISLWSLDHIFLMSCDWNLGVMILRELQLLFPWVNSLKEYRSERCSIYLPCFCKHVLSKSCIHPWKIISSFVPIKMKKIYYSVWEMT